MAEDGPDRRNPLGPYFPTESGPLMGFGRSWWAVFMILIILLGIVVPVVVLVVTG